MAQSKIKALERMELVEPPESYDLSTFHGDFEPLSESVKDVLITDNLTIGFKQPLATINLKVQKQLFKEVVHPHFLVFSKYKIF